MCGPPPQTDLHWPPSHPDSLLQPVGEGVPRWGYVWHCDGSDSTRARQFCLQSPPGRAPRTQVRPRPDPDLWPSTVQVTNVYPLPQDGELPGWPWQQQDQHPGDGWRQATACRRDDLHRPHVPREPAQSAHVWRSCDVQLHPGRSTALLLVTGVGGSDVLITDLFME